LDRFFSKSTIPNEEVFLYGFGPIVNYYLESGPTPYFIAFYRRFQGAKLELFIIIFSTTIVAVSKCNDIITNRMPCQKALIRSVFLQYTRYNNVVVSYGVSLYKNKSRQQAARYNKPNTSRVAGKALIAPFLLVVKAAAALANLRENRYTN
jgi:hypothetical protein